MLINPAYLGSMGEGGASWLNGPSLQNWGMELQLGYRHTTKYGLRYNINGNIDFYRSKVTYLPETTTGSYAHTSKENLVESKKPYGSIVGYVVDGLFQNREEVLASGQENARVGGLKYADLDGNGVINENDQTGCIQQPEVPDRLLQHHRCWFQQRQPHAGCMDHWQYGLGHSRTHHQQYR